MGRAVRIRQVQTGLLFYISTFSPSLPLQDLLLNQTEKIENIALECGFSSQQYFWRMFKKEYHLSPSEYRKTRKIPFEFKKPGFPPGF